MQVLSMSLDQRNGQIHDVKLNWFFWALPWHDSHSSGHFDAGIISRELLNTLKARFE